MPPDFAIRESVAADLPAIRRLYADAFPEEDLQPLVTALLGPLAVAPRQQRRGIGGALIRDGLHRLEADSVVRVLVLGDPAYYGRFGFTAEADILPPYPLPGEWVGAWQSICMGAARPPVRGTLSVPQPWRQPALWA